MKAIICAFAVICLLTGFAYADTECDAKYLDKKKKLNSLTHSEMSDETKSRYISKLEEAYQLCKEGKKEEARAVWTELTEDKEFDTVFSGMDGN